MLRTQFGPTPVVRNIIFINIAVFLLQNLGTGVFNGNLIEKLFALNYFSVMYDYRVWQIFTYMFLHGGLWHLGFNMLALYFIGMEIERFLGSRPFLTYYLLTGLGAGIFIFMIDSAEVLFFSQSFFSLGTTLGASGAIFGLILLYSVLFKERVISVLLFFVIPVNIKAKNLVLVTFGLSLLFSFFMGSGVRISHAGHFGGILSGILFIILFKKNRSYRSAYNGLAEWSRDLFSRVKRVRKKPHIGRFDSIDYSSRFRFNQDSLDETKMTEREIEEKIDELLDIIAVKGLRGLNEKEKAFLERVSLLYRHKFPN